MRVPHRPAGHETREDARSRRPPRDRPITTRVEADAYHGRAVAAHGVRPFPPRHA